MVTMNKQTLLFYKIFSIFSYLNAEEKKKVLDCFLLGGDVSFKSLLKN